MYRGYSEIDLIQMLSIKDGIQEDEDTPMIELELITTSFKSRSIFMVFFDDL